MVSRINKLHNAIQGAKVHLSESVEQHSNHELKTGETEQISDSRMSRLIGKNKIMIKESHCFCELEPKIDLLSI